MSSASTVEEILNEIIKARNALSKEFDKSPKKDDHCPYCGYAGIIFLNELDE